MRLFRRAVILSHRYLGIVLSLLVIMWFATGITMMYWGGMPRVTPELRLERMQPVDFAHVQLTPAQAAERADLDTLGRVTLATLLDRPVYRFGSRNPTRRLRRHRRGARRAVAVEQAQAVARDVRAVPGSQVHHVAHAARRSISGRCRRRCRCTSSASTTSRDRAVRAAASGEVAMMTTRSSRGWAWVSTIPHWLYFTALRTNQPLWYRLLVWTSIARLRAGCARPGAQRHADPREALTRPPGSSASFPASARSRTPDRCAGTTSAASSLACSR